MSLVRPKKLDLDARGDIIIGSNNVNNNGEILLRGLDNQVYFQLLQQ